MWKLLNNDNDWLTHKNSIYALFPDTRFKLNFASDPKEYPCLVDTLVPASVDSVILNTDSVILKSAFVYSADASLLLRDKETPKEAPSIIADQAAQQQARFNMWVSASLLTIAGYLTQTGLCVPRGGPEANETSYEKTLEEMLLKVQALRNEQKTDAVLLTKHQQKLLNTLI